MFTGIIEETGTVVSFEEQQNSWRLVLAAEVVTKDLQMGDSVAVNGCCLTAVAFDQSRIEFDLLGETKRLTSIDGVGPGGKVNTKDLQMGDSVAVNGCCLTAVAFDQSRIEFDLLGETKRLTSIDGVGPGGKVNLERALLPSTRMGGHFVSGHVDGTGVIEAIEPRGKDFFFRIKPDADKLKYIVSKGCITVDGISLTVSEVEESGFAIWLIPHTMEVTNLHTKQVGDRVNLEYDLIAKYVEKLFAPQG